MKKTALIVLLSVRLGTAAAALFWANSVQAQCPADANLDGRVSAAEITKLVMQFPAEDFLSRAVADVFSPGCVDFCPLTFRDSTSRAGYSCLYRGTAYNSYSPAGHTCEVGDIEATWTSDGTNVILTFLNVTVAPFPGAPGGLIHFGATVHRGDERRADLVGWWTDLDSDLIPVSGSVTIKMPLVARFGSAPFTIAGCSLLVYGSEYDGRLLP